MASNSTNASLQAEVKTADDMSFSLSALNNTLPALFIGLFIMYCAFHRAYKLCVAKSQSHPTAVDNNRLVVASVVSYPSKTVASDSFIRPNPTFSADLFGPNSCNDDSDIDALIPTIELHSSFKSYEPIANLIILSTLCKRSYTARCVDVALSRTPV
jgi:hypothetical protein